MKYRYISNMPYAGKGRKFVKGDIVNLTEKELRDLPFWKFEKVEKAERPEVKPKIEKEVR